MRIRFHGYFRRAAGKNELQLTLKGALTLDGLIRHLSSNSRGFELLQGCTDDAELSAHAVFVRNGSHLRLIDAISDEDEIDVLIPSAGG